MFYLMVALFEKEYNITMFIPSYIMLLFHFISLECDLCFNINVVPCHLSDCFEYVSSQEPCLTCVIVQNAHPPTVRNI